MVETGGRKEGRDGGVGKTKRGRNGGKGGGGRDKGEGIRWRKKGNQKEGRRKCLDKADGCFNFCPSFSSSSLITSSICCPLSLLSLTIQPCLPLCTRSLVISLNTNLSF